MFFKKLKLVKIYQVSAKYPVDNNVYNLSVSIDNINILKIN